MVPSSITPQRAEFVTRLIVPALVACGALAAGRPAAAVPAFSFQATSGTAIQAETIGDPGGSSFSLANGWPAGQGLPTALGGWPTSAPGFAADASFGGNLGITGYHTANLYLTEPASCGSSFWAGATPSSRISSW